MQALALPVRRAGFGPAAAARARSQSDHIRPVKPRPPTRRASRRVMPSHRRTLRPRMESMAAPLLSRFYRSRLLYEREEPVSFVAVRRGEMWRTGGTGRYN